MAGASAAVAAARAVASPPAAQAVAASRAAVASHLAAVAAVMVRTAVARVLSWRRKGAPPPSCDCLSNESGFGCGSDYYRLLYVV